MHDEFLGIPSSYKHIISTCQIEGNWILDDRTAKASCQGKSYSPHTYHTILIVEILKRVDLLRHKYFNNSRAGLSANNCKGLNDKLGEKNLGEVGKNLKLIYFRGFILSLKKLSPTFTLNVVNKT